jgi:molybdopterin synthase catalytic subunit
MIPLSSFHQVAVDDLSHMSPDPIDIAGLISRSHHPGAGALVLFSGEVRDSNAGKHVTYLEYEAYVSMASKMITSILNEARSKWSLKTAIASHRIGKVEVGESAVVVITSSAHRKEAYMANKFIIDKIKHEVPIWKCEYFADGTKEWGGNCNCNKITGDISTHVYDGTGW